MKGRADGRAARCGARACREAKGGVQIAQLAVVLLEKPDRVRWNSRRKQRGSDDRPPVIEERAVESLEASLPAQLLEPCQLCGLGGNALTLRSQRGGKRFLFAGVSLVQPIRGIRQRRLRGCEARERGAVVLVVVVVEEAA